MSVATESEVQRATGSSTSSATPNAVTTDTLVAAPAANFRLRIYALSVTWQITATTAPPALNSVLVFRGAVLAAMLGIDYPAQPSDRWALPQGVPLAAATALTIAVSGSAASLSYAYGVHYVTEPT